MKERKVYSIPKYLDDMPEVLIIPIDVFFIGIIVAASLFMINTAIAVLAGIFVAWRYSEFKKGKPKNYFQLILYKIAFYKGEGLPSPVVKRFKE